MRIVILACLVAGALVGCGGGDDAKRGGDQDLKAVAEELAKALKQQAEAADKQKSEVAEKTEAEDGADREAAFAARSNARNAVSWMERCYTDEQSYEGCDLSDSDLPVGPGPGEVEISEASKRTYTVTSRSTDGHTFEIQRAGDGMSDRRCSGGSGCTNGAW
jgi:hypothetical protein